ncbi:trypsin delta-like [Schistocerca gregaria]|uniref:trypsin delta-like n=1 Tax=Schistocerca gregaria TaxID=7010 RepID=UPI00211E2864|nr:trypsin delta-like [Schistocerca gregaria]
MQTAVVLCLLVALCSAAPSSRSHLPRPRLDGRIVGGEAVDISQYPWQLSLQKLGSHSCGASIISSNWVLTAAHCLEGAFISFMSFRAGSSIRESGGTVYDAADGYYHQDYDSITTDYDIGVVQISGSFSFDSNVQAVSLGSTEPSAGTAVTVTGWGDLSIGGSSPLQLQAVTTSIVARTSCNSAYGGEITWRMICAGEDAGGKDSCQGDSGGPLVEGSTQYGIVSWGRGCALPGYPGVYANVANLRSWVTQVSGV